MTRLAKYLKPYVLTVIVCIILLFGQAFCDLSLPNFMSDIVNTGIQKKGIENCAPDAISEEGFNFISIFMTQEQRDTFEENYSKIDSNPKLDDYKSYDTYSKNIEKYPLLNQESIYVLNKDEKTDIDELNNIFSSSCLTMLSCLKEMSQQYPQTVDYTSEHDSEIDLSKLYSLTPIVKNIPQEKIDEIVEETLNVDQYVRDQTGSVFTDKFYEELGVDISSIQNSYTLRIGIYMIIITLIGSSATMLVSFFASRISAGVSKSLRRDMFSKVESFSNTEFDRFSTASLITRTTNDITQIQSLLMTGIRMICYAPIIGIGGIIMASSKSISMTWIIALGVCVLIGLIIVIFSISLPKFKSIQKLVDKLNLVTREHLSGIMVIRAFGNQDFEENRFNAANKELTDVNRFVNRAITFLMPAMMFIMNGTSLLIVWVGANEISKSNMQVGDMMAFMQYSMQIIIAFLMISIMFIMVPRAAVSADRIADVLETEPVIKDKRRPAKLSEHHKVSIEFKNVWFKYEGASEAVLKNISFEGKQGETIAFIGATGSGKSTLVNLVPRFYDATEGEILIDGINVKDVSQHELHDYIGYVPQKGVLFSGTIATNLKYGKPDATDKEMIEASEVAQACEFIDNMDKGYQSPISQGGTNVSGGQKQRLSIARALVKKAKIFIFDDSFSALDFKTDAAIRKALPKYTRNSIVLIVAQRVSTIMHADQIIVLDEGEIVGKGTHTELLENCPTYKEIASSQLSKEEL